MKRAFTLLEVMVTVAVLGIGAVMVSRGLTTAIRAQKMARDSLRAAWVCEGALTKLEILGFNSSSGAAIKNKDEAGTEYNEATLSSGASPWTLRLNSAAGVTVVDVNLDGELVPVGGSHQVYSIKSAQPKPNSGEPPLIGFNWSTHCKKNP